jgi:uncharacterized protein with FMN-binding domain
MNENLEYVGFTMWNQATAQQQTKKKSVCKANQACCNMKYEDGLYLSLKTALCGTITTFYCID